VPNFPKLAQISPNLPEKSDIQKKKIRLHIDFERHFVNQSTSSDFAKVFTHFFQIFKDFARTFRDFARIFTKSKRLGMLLHPHLQHH